MLVACTCLWYCLFLTVLESFKKIKLYQFWNRNFWDLRIKSGYLPVLPTPPAPSITMECFSPPLEAVSESLLPDFNLFARRLGRFFDDWKSSLVGLSSSFAQPKLLLLLANGFLSAEYGNTPKLPRRANWWERCCGGVKLRGWRIDVVPQNRRGAVFSRRKDMWYSRSPHISTVRSN